MSGKFSAASGLQSAAFQREPSPATAAPPPAPACAQSRATRLLLAVDDDPDDFRLLQRAVQKAGVTAAVRWAKDGSEALEILSQLGPEVASVCVLSDITLPGMSGFELLKGLRAMKLSVPTRFAFLTGNTQPSIQTHAHASGADAFYLKSCSYVDLIDVARAVDELLSNSPRVTATP